MTVFKKLKNKKGVTLAECIVAIAIFAIMSTMVYSAMSNSFVMTGKAVKAEQRMSTLDAAMAEDTLNGVQRSDIKEIKINTNASGAASDIWVTSGYYLEREYTIDGATVTGVFSLKFEETATQYVYTTEDGRTLTYNK